MGWRSSAPAPFFFRADTIHTDPHPDNHRIAADGQSTLYGFGSFRRFPTSFVQGAWTLREALHCGGATDKA